ncbi:sensor domain-containing diguanylate cyclase [Rhodopseudomonas palustris]|uniref:diguanylate cyclase n=1 Tax=Rhodopseudomonas palustris (strain DX-1) TaxID=652103 RepID=E6VCH0_RHOPX|nr:diguanylate cyclase [Rhodopseudomonas palustris]QDL95897.1 diguanylate cyclase [Rhodopseudomonas palustris]
MDTHGLLDTIKKEIHRRRRISARLMVGFSLVTVLGFSAVCGSVLLDMRRGAEELARQTLENLAASIDADINRNIELYDASLRSVANNLLLPELRSVSPPIDRLILFDHLVPAPHLGAIRVYDEHGDLTRDSAVLHPAKENRSDQPFFAVHRDEPYFGLYISGPQQLDGQYSVVVSRRINGPGGQFLGVVAGSIKFGYFQDLFKRLRLRPNDMIAVLAQDGTLVVRNPFTQELIGKNMMFTPGVQKMFERRNGWFAGVGTVDGVQRMFVWSDSTKPLVVLVAKSWDDIYAMWRREATWIGIVLLVLATFVAAVTVFFLREIDRRAQAERQLEELAITDPLTGLTNRRKFDAAIDTEWRRAIRQNTPIALLMIDADHFKAYNDRFGHQAGDQMLVGIAVCIADTVQRAGDCAARFGGEEFAVLLPGLTASAAEAVAETIRRKVQEWSDIEGGVTVSVGVASTTPAAAHQWHDLVEAADRALYAAKELGRNRCVVAVRGEVTLVA